MKAILKPPREHFYGNLLWSEIEGKEYLSLIQSSLVKIRALGYFASLYPEGDGVAFQNEMKNDNEILLDFSSTFNWLEITIDTTFDETHQTKNAPLPSLGFENNTTLPKVDIALMQLEDAIDLCIEGRRVSAITLAGAAEGIFSGILKQQNELSSAEESWEQVEQLREETGLPIAGDRNRKDAFAEWNRTRNRLKHHNKKDDDMLEFNIFDEAYYAIKRAISDAEKIGLTVKNSSEYENWIVQNVCL